MDTAIIKIRWSTMIAMLGAFSLCVCVSFGQQNRDIHSPDFPQKLTEAPKAVVRPPKNRRTLWFSNFSRSARITYQATWGIDNLVVKEVSSGAMLRFSYRVMNANKAKALHDEKSKPYLIDEKSGAVLQVPDLPKVGELRSKMTPENGKEYWMVFSNKSFIKPGNRVDIVIGTFRVNGLIVR